MTWRPKQPGAAALDIPALISPLRYDVHVRAQFFSVIGQRPRDESVEALMRAVRDSAYVEWFERVAMARFRPWVLKHPDLFDDQLTERVATARALYWSFKDRGFDRRHPIMLRRTLKPTRSDSGALIRPRLHVADGGHRLALLLQSGGVAEPHTYIVDPRPTEVIDNTVRLFTAADADSPTYLRFLAAGYLAEPAGSAVTSAEDLVTAVSQARGAETADELSGILLAHRRAWGVT